jgi:hypothetical protein
MKSTMRRLFLRLAFLAVLLNALAPSVSHALATLHPAVPIEACSEHGGLQFAAAAALLTQAQDHHHGANALLDDCGYCVPHAGAGGMPPSALAALPLLHAPAERPYLFYHAPRPLPLLSAAAPRGPPPTA